MDILDWFERIMALPLIPLNENENYWELYKKEEPEEAEQIESVADENFMFFSNEDVEQKIHSFIRFSSLSGNKISELKRKSIQNLIDIMSEDHLSLDEVEKIFKENFEKKINSEANNFNIKPYNTTTYYMNKWVMEWIKEQKKQQMEKQMSEILEQYGLNMSDMQEQIDAIKLAPDLSCNDNLENRLFKLAKEGVGFIDRYYKELSENGRKETLIYCSCLLVNIGNNHGNELDLEKLEDKYFLLLHDEVMDNTSIEIEDTINFLNQRIGFYTSVSEKIKHDDGLSIIDQLYYMFYVNPLDNLDLNANIHIDEKESIKLKSILLDISIKYDQIDKNSL